MHVAKTYQVKTKSISCACVQSQWEPRPAQTKVIPSGVTPSTEGHPGDWTEVPNSSLAFSWTFLSTASMAPSVHHGGG